MYILKIFSVYGAIFMHIVTGILAYHFDVDNIISYQDEARNNENRSSYFGYSVALWNTSSEQSWIFIGAPRANSTSYNGVIEPGTIFKCEIGGSCQEWTLKNENWNRPQNGSWVGGSINIGRNKTEDIVLVCAPRWVNIEAKDVWWTMSGMCYQASPSSFSRPNGPVGKALSPLNKTEAYVKKNFYYAMGQAGFSTHIVSNPESLKYILGCPGVHLWHGTLIFTDKNDKDRFITPNVLKDKTVPDHSYSGYAVTSGFYFRESRRMYATGAPRAANLRGTVIVVNFPRHSNYDWIIKAEMSVSGDQIGEYFGSALASCDVNGDRKDELLVGAPQWSKNSDEGRIYIFTAKNTAEFADGQHIDGETLRGRFGSEITCLGDIDYDGFDDIAVGAPYDGNGAVYIYHGGKDAIRLTQKISAPEDNKGFGISISKPRDIDENGYGDIAVGAYLSGHVTVFRSKRVVNMTVTLSGLSEGPLGHNPKPFLVSICSSYSGRYAPEELNVTTELKLDEIYRRAEFDINGKYERIYTFNDTMKKSNTSCRNVTIIIKEMNEDFVNPIIISAVQRLDTINKNGMLLMKRNNTDENEYLYDFSAVMSEAHQEVQRHLDVLFALDCGEDNICNSNLSIHMRTDLEDINRYVIGSTPYIKLDIEVINTGEQAYGAKAVIIIPQFIGLHVIPSACTKVEKHNRIICDIGNPLDSNDAKNVTLELDMSQVTNNIEQFYLNATAMTRISHDSVSRDHETSLLINCVAETDIGIAGKANNDSYWYVWKEEKEVLLPIMFQHIYEIRNYEVTPISEAQLSVSIPTHLIHGGNEIEVVKLKKTSGNLDKREFSCMDPEEDGALTMTDHLMSNNSSLRFVPQAEKNLTIVEGKTFDATLDNRTLHINCTNPSFKWKTINCKFGPFKTGISVAKVILTFELLLPNFTPEIIQKKDIILFVTNASTRVTMPLGTTQTVNNMPDSILIGTMFLGSLPTYQLPSMLIPLSVAAGLLLLIFVILGLLKLGFFKRSKKIELEALKKEKNNMCPKVILETTSSTEALDMT